MALCDNKSLSILRALKGSLPKLERALIVWNIIEHRCGVIGRRTYELPDCIMELEINQESRCKSAIEVITLPRNNHAWQCSDDHVRH